jgi:hypothetical protein
MFRCDIVSTIEMALRAHQPVEEHDDYTDECRDRVVRESRLLQRAKVRAPTGVAGRSVRRCNCTAIGAFPDAV